MGEQCAISQLFVYPSVCFGLVGSNVVHARVSVCASVCVCRLLFARDDALKRVGPDGPSYEIAQIEDNYSTHIFRQVLE